MSPVDLVIRPATAEDVPLVLRFIAKKAEFDGCPDSVEATPERIGAALAGDPPLAGVLFAEIGGSAVGFATYFRTFSTFLARPGIWLDDLYVDADRRGRGVGRALLRHLAQMAQKQGCGRIEWTASAANGRGLAFYRREGASVLETARLCRLDRAAIQRLADSQ